MDQQESVKTCKIVAMSHFISQLSDKSISFFKILKTNSSFAWTPECGNVQRLKHYLPTYFQNLSMVTRYTYAWHQNLSMAIYYVSEVPLDTKTWNSNIENLALALFIPIQKLCPNFQCHNVVVVTLYPFKVVLYSYDIAVTDEVICHSKWTSYFVWTTYCFKNTRICWFCGQVHYERTGPRVGQQAGQRIRTNCMWIALQIHGAIVYE